MKEIAFTKMHGIGNDYVYINCMDGEVDEPESKFEKWMRENINDMTFYGVTDDGSGEEILYLRRTEVIRYVLHEEYPELEESFAETLIENFYNEYFEGDKE